MADVVPLRKLDLSVPPDDGSGPLFDDIATALDAVAEIRARFEAHESRGRKAA